MTQYGIIEPHQVKPTLATTMSWFHRRTRCPQHGKCTIMSMKCWLSARKNLIYIAMVAMGLIILIESNIKIKFLSTFCDLLFRDLLLKPYKNTKQVEDKYTLRWSQSQALWLWLLMPVITQLECCYHGILMADFMDLCLILHIFRSPFFFMQTGCTSH